MRKIIVWEMVSVDGFFAGENGDISWHVVDAEFNNVAIEMLKNADTLIFGRVTYDLMAGYWPGEGPVKDDPIVAGFMNSLAKVVYSKTQDKLAWNNSTLKSEIVADEVLKMKQAPGKDILLMGSGTIVRQFAELGLIDEYGFVVAPVAIGKGKGVFDGIKQRIKLKLLKTKQMASGSVILYYTP